MLEDIKPTFTCLCCNSFVSWQNLHWNYRINLRQTFQLEHVKKFCMSEPISYISDLNCHAEFTSKIETFVVICTAKRQVVKWEVNKLAVTKLGTFSVLRIVKIFRYLFHLIIVFISFCFPPRTALLKIHLRIILILSYTLFFLFFIRTSSFGAETDRSFFCDLRLKTRCRCNQETYQLPW